MPDQSKPKLQQPLPGLMLGALGVVFGDIGTSPIYALRECLKSAGDASPAMVIGIVSLLLWSVVIVVLLKYTVLVMRADNGGEGGILALTALATSRVNGRRHEVLLLVGLFGAAMFYGDSMVTPAISVLSAVEGLKQVNPGLQHWVLPIGVGILCLLFLFERRGSSGVGRVFGPVMALWFFSLAALGVYRIAQRPEILAALSPLPALRFLTGQPGLAFRIGGSAILALTGAEALYADIGHFGRRAIRLSWLGLVLPCIVLGYCGEAATVLARPQAAADPYFASAPGWALAPLVGIAVAATVIASQAVISGAFSLTRQALEIGVMPRVGVIQTSAREPGQIYVPAVNAVLFAAVLFLALFFRSSDRLTSAYGIAVSLTMLATTVLLWTVARSHWRWSALRAGVVIAPLLAVDGFYAAATLPKIVEGGWFPLCAGTVMLLLMTTWRRVRQCSVAMLQAEGDDLAQLLRRTFDDAQPPARVPGTAVYPGSIVGVAPTPFLHNLDFNHIAHQTCIFFANVVESSPRVDDEERLELEDLGHGCWQVTVHHGFKERPDMPRLLSSLEGRLGDWRYRADDTVFFLPRDTLDPHQLRGRVAAWRVRLYSLLSEHVEDAAEYYHLPPRRVVEMGVQLSP